MVSSTAEPVEPPPTARFPRELAARFGGRTFVLDPRRYANPECSRIVLADVALTPRETP